MKAVIYAIDESFGFGNNDGSLPWGKPFPSDMLWFKSHSQSKEFGSNCVMGVNTFKSLPSKLKDRKNIVLCDLTRSVEGIKAKDGSKPDNFIQYSPNHSFKLVIDRLSAFGYNDFIIIGGKDIIEHSLPLVDWCFITRVGKIYNADIIYESKFNNLKVKKEIATEDVDKDGDTVTIVCTGLQVIKE